MHLKRTHYSTHFTYHHNCFWENMQLSSLRNDWAIRIPANSRQEDSTGQPRIRFSQFSMNRKGNTVDPRTMRLWTAQDHLYMNFFSIVNTIVLNNKLWEIQKEMGIPDHLTCLLRNLYASQEATVRTGHGTIDCFQIGKRSTSRLNYPSGP